MLKRIEVTVWVYRNGQTHQCTIRGDTHKNSQRHAPLPATGMRYHFGVGVCLKLEIAESTSISRTTREPRRIEAAFAEFSRVEVITSIVESITRFPPSSQENGTLVIFVSSQ